MDVPSVARGRARDPEGGGKHPPSSPDYLADGPYCGLLAEDLGCKVSTARTAFIGEPKVRCIRVVEWALRHEPDDPERRAKLIIAWAKKRRAGAFRRDEDRDRPRGPRGAGRELYGPPGARAAPAGARLRLA